MLRSLSIRDFVIVDRLDLEFEAGFTALTGETGVERQIELIDENDVADRQAREHRVRAEAPLRTASRRRGA